jgi:hypothetical protein
MLDGGLVPSAATVHDCSIRVLVVADADVLLRHDLPLFPVPLGGNRYPVQECHGDGTQVSGRSGGVRLSRI